ncbi:MAG TPA: hypothetical protein VHS31_09980 [Tepidisphaeraceae bacterium]|nr:hypothetical protein [Tepidisphaeraceae bacterium]
MRSKWIVILSCILGLTALAPLARAEEKKEKEENEVQVKFADLPPAVQATLNKASNNAAIATVDKETEDGKTTYEADVKLDGKNYEVKVAEDGSLISKKIDDDDKDEKDDKK